MGLVHIFPDIVESETATLCINVMRRDIEFYMPQLCYLFGGGMKTGCSLHTVHRESSGIMELKSLSLSVLY